MADDSRRRMQRHGKHRQKRFASLRFCTLVAVVRRNGRAKAREKKEKRRKKREIAREMVIEAERGRGRARARQISSRYTNIPLVGSQRSHPRFFPGNYAFALPGVAKFKVSLVRIARRASWSEMGRVPEEGRKTRSSQREQNARACECVQFNDFQPEFR